MYHIFIWHCNHTGCLLDKQFFGGLAGGRLLATYSSSVAVTPVKVIFKNLDSNSIELSASFEDEI